MTLQYPMVRGSGAFLVCLGLGIVMGALWPGPSAMNGAVFITGAVLAIAAIPLARRLFGVGRPAPIHVVAMIAAVTLEFVLFWSVFARLPHNTPPEVGWLWAFLIVGVHFIPMGLALGKRVVILAAACIAVAVLGLLFRQLPFTYLAIVDGLLKVGFGVSLATTGLPRLAFTTERSHEYLEE